MFYAIALTALSLVDIWTTAALLRRGATELNPVVAEIIARAGIGGMVGWKAVTVAAVVVLMERGVGRRRVALYNAGYSLLCGMSLAIAAANTAELVRW